MTFQLHNTQGVLFIPFYFLLWLFTSFCVEQEVMHMPWPTYGGVGSIMGVLGISFRVSDKTVSDFMR